jgi:hypothetical protein
MQVNGEQTDHIPETDVGFDLLTGLGGLRMRISTHDSSLLPDRAGKLPTSYHTLR